MALPLAACGGTQSALDPRGPGADHVARIWWFMLALAAIIFVLVMGLLLFALFHRRGLTARGPGPLDGLVFVLVGGALLPLVVLAVLIGVMVAGMRQLSAAERVAHPPEEFAAWLAQQAQPAASPRDDLAGRGREVFLSSSCVSCHTIRGTEASARVGPDLTHLASRGSLAALTIPNDRSNL